MKNFILVALLSGVLNISSFSQLFPPATNEFCPNTTLHFILVVDGQYESAALVSLQNCSIMVNPSVSYNSSDQKTTISFAVSFTDDNRVVHRFTVNRTTPAPNPQTTSSTHTFAKVKSLAQAKLITGLPASLNVPFCQTNPVALSFTAIPWLDATVNPAIEFGQVSTYSYVLPAGWTLNGTTSNGSNPILGLSNVAIVPHPLTGGDIKVTPINNCGGGLYNGTTQSVPITGRQTISISSGGQSTIKYFCGDQAAKTITLDNASLAACITGYTWNLGANNGWIYNGSAAPATITTSTPSITLTPACNNNALPSNISVTTSGAVGTWSIAVEKIPPPVSVSGYLGICSSAVYSVAAPCGSTVNWSASPANIVTLTPNGNQVTVYAGSSANGTFILTANVVTTCGDSYNFTKSIPVGSANLNIKYIISNNPPYYDVIFPNGSNGAGFMGPAGGYAVSAGITGLSLTGTTTMTWTLQGGYGYTNYSTNSNASSVNVSWNFPPASNSPTVALRLQTVNNGCTLDRYPVFIEPPGGGFVFRVGPNPAITNLYIDKVEGIVSENRISVVKIIDITGVVKKVMKVNQARSVVMPVHELPEGIYVIEITSGSYTERKKIKILR